MKSLCCCVASSPQLQQQHQNRFVMIQKKQYRESCRYEEVNEEILNHWFEDIQQQHVMKTHIKYISNYIESFLYQQQNQYYDNGLNKTINNPMKLLAVAQFI